METIIGLSLTAGLFWFLLKPRRPRRIDIMARIQMHNQMQANLDQINHKSRRTL